MAPVRFPKADGVQKPLGRDARVGSNPTSGTWPPGRSMRIRTYAAAALAIIGLLAFARAGEASTTPDSQGAICQAALEVVMATDQDVSARYSMGSVHPIFLRGKGNRPDEWVIDFHRRVAVLEASFRQAARALIERSP